MKNYYHKIAFLFTFIPSSLLQAQIIFSDGATIFVSNSGVLTSNGGISLVNNTNLSNFGNIKVTKNATNLLPGTFTIASASTLDGNGNYEVEQDWINDATFSAGSSSVLLFGNTQQFITSTNNTVTEFNQLILTGTGVGLDRKKTLQNVDSRISLTGQLILNNRECATQTNNMTVLNPSSNAITNSLTFGDEGFVSSDVPGYLYWTTNSIDSYVFPVGSSNGTKRYRPVVIRPNSSSLNEYAVRMDNVIADTYGYFLAQNDADISTANTLFFHSIERVSGSSNTDISVSYLPSTDGDWYNLAHWTDNTNLWNSMGTTTDGTMSNYSFVQKASWDFPDIYFPFVLVNNVYELIIPTAFTPSADGVNDNWEILGLDAYTDNVVMVFNRWGSKLYESEPGNYANKPWNGTFEGSPLPVGSYYFIIDLHSDKTEPKKGIVSIILE